MHVYRAADPQRRAVGRAVADSLDLVFKGSAEPVWAQLVQKRRLSQKDLDEISRMIRERK